MNRLGHMFERGIGLFLLARGLHRLSARSDTPANIQGAFDIADASLRLGLDRQSVELLRARPIAAATMAARYGVGATPAPAQLRAMPAGSLGRLLWDGIQRGYDPNFYRVPKNRAVDTDVGWINHRGRQLHDALHIVTGYPPTIVGEIGLFAFLAANMLSYSCLVIAVVALVGHLLLRPSNLAVDLSVFARAWTYGRRIGPVLGLELEAFYTTNIVRVRALLGLPRVGLGRLDLNDKLLQGYGFEDCAPKAEASGRRRTSYHLAVRSG